MDELSLTLMVMSKELTVNQHQDAVGYMKATRESWFYYATHKAEMNKIYLKESNLTIDEKILDTIASHEPNASVQSLDQVDIGLTEEQINDLQQTLDFLVEKGRIQRGFDIRSRIDLSLLRKAQSK